MLSPHQVFSDPRQPQGHQEEDEDEAQEKQIIHVLPTRPDCLHRSSTGVKAVSRRRPRVSRKYQEMWLKKGTGNGWSTRELQA